MSIHNFSAAIRAVKKKHGFVVGRSHENERGLFLRVRCEHGHVWTASTAKLAAGSWCLGCTKAGRSWDKMNEFVRARNGRILSSRSEYRNGSSRLTWICSKGHRWTATAGSVLAEHWCRKCHVLTRRTPISFLQKYAKKRGGELLSESHPDMGSEYSWRCEKGHEWTAGAEISKLGRWCKRCAYDEFKHTIQDMQALAAKRGGVCVSENYVTLRDKLRWRCANGHEWETMPAVILKGAWCVKCTSPKLNSIEKLRAIVEKKGGKCLSPDYLGTSVKLRFRCEFGHRWETSPNAIQSGSWCHVCTNTKDGSIEDMHRLAKKMGGTCLSSEYINNKTKLLWACSKGHEFWLKPNHVKSRNQWCLECGGRKKRTIEDIRAIAEKRGGKCHSKSFQRSSDRLSLECHLGHRWETIAAGFIHGTWCPVCAGNRRGASRPQVAASAQA